MSMAFNERLKNFITRIKAVKHIEIIIAVIAVALMILIFSGIGGKKTSQTGSTTTKGSETVTNAEVVTVSDWENRLSKILSQIDGVGETKVMITVKSTAEKITAKTVSTNTSSSQSGSGNVTTSTNTTESPVIVSNGGTSEPYVLKEIMPEVLGVIVVAEGADNAITKLAIMRAVQTALQVNAACVEIYPMK